MSIADCVEYNIHFYNTDNVRDLVDYHNITIQYNDILNKNSDSTLVVIEGKPYLTLKFDLDPLYENFLLAHELGHFLLHYDDNISFTYLLRTRKTALEREANEFACRLLLYDINIKEVENMEFVVKEKGIPLKIWYSVNELIFPQINNVNN